jgi:transcription-repair coupling factor (superfamily II helicase)
MIFGTFFLSSMTESITPVKMALFLKQTVKNQPMSNSSPLQPPMPNNAPQRLIWGNLTGSSLGLAISRLIANSQKPVVIITPDMAIATQLEYEIRFFQQDTQIIPFPDWETLPYDQFSPHQDIISARLAALNQIPALTHGAIITPISTLMHRLTPREFLTGNLFIFKTGDKLNINDSRKNLEKAGYRCVNQVREHGEFAVRGAILDLFPMGSELPYRFDLFDDEIDSIRTFSPDTQRSLEKIDKIALLPAKEFPLNDDAIELFRQNWRSQFSGNPLNCSVYQDISEGICPPGIEYYLPFFFEKTATLFDYLPPDALIITINEIHPKAEEFWHEVRERYDQRAHDIIRPILTPQQSFISVPEIFSAIQNYSNIKILATPVSENQNQTNFATQPAVILSVNHKATRPLLELENFLASYQGRVLFCAETAGRREVLLQLFNTIQLHPKQFHSWEEFLNDNAQYGITVAPLDEGLSLTDPAIAVIAEGQLFGKRIMQRRRRKESTQDVDAIIKDLTELQIGSPIVHIDHGVGRYLGLQTLDVGEQLTEFLCLEYSGGDKLYVPVAALHLISRYSGAEADTAPLHKLGTEQWQKAKRKAAEDMEDVAADLLDIYAQREAQQGFACKDIDDQYTAFAAAFPFEETPDQQNAIQQVLHDMMSDKPMDRLVCGDVGFGKTEVAMRAAFMAIQNNKQAVILVPTTLLAQQHYQSFQNRFADWPIRVDVMSRFRTAKEQQQMLSALAEGKIDIIVGTHKLLQEDVKFKSLGLVVIDEEHRFGVKQKERLKALRHNVDVLNLTATPIPRTLNMAFAGIRDLSLIATPPARRLSVKTFVHEYQSSLIKEAVLREILRGGQVYFLHNEVASIERMARELESLIPEARVAVAHGQMHERELEQVMAEFYHRRFNLLISSTIIESGIDIPSANTIIINRADKFGLAQLHQLRGRVGRSHHQAYAYLLTPPRKQLTSDAIKRLDAISSLEDLGIGFTLATHDLEIRGAGELLGKNQSGNMQEIGFTLYMELLSRAVASLKSGKKPALENLTPERGAEIELQIPALIPADYLGDVHLRLQCYKRIASAKTTRELDEIQVEMIDRFGLIPDATKNLFAIGLLKQHTEKLGIKKIEANSKGGKIEFNDKPNIDPMQIIKLIQTQAKQFRLDGPTKLRFTLPEHQASDRLNLIEGILQRLKGK